MPKTIPFWRARDLCHANRDRRNEPAEVLLHRDQDDAAEWEAMEDFAESQERFVYDFLCWSLGCPEEPTLPPSNPLPNPLPLEKKGRDYREGMINNPRPALLW
jgi:hypothetical protein